MRELKDGWIQNYLKYTENQESPRNFHLWTGFTVLAAALKRHVWLDRGGKGKGGYYILYPNLYTVLVALSAACRKSVSSGLGIRMLKKISNARFYQGILTTQALIEYMAQSPQQKIGSKVVVDSSVTFYASELQAFLSKQSFAQDIIPILTDLYEGQDLWTYRTKTGGELAVPNVSPTFFGATTPENLSLCISSKEFGLGFPGRILFIVEQSRQKAIPWPLKSEEQQDLEIKLIKDLDYISNNLYGQFTVEQDAYDFFANWYRNYKANNENPSMAGYFERKQDFVLKIAMLLSISINDSLTLRAFHINHAIKLLEIIEPNMPLAFQYTGTDLSSITETVLDTLQNATNYTLSHREILSKVRPKIKSVQEISDVLNILKETGFIKDIIQDGHRYYQLVQVRRVNNQTSDKDFKIVQSEVVEE